MEVLGTDEYPGSGELYYGVFEESALENVRLPSTLRRIEYAAFQGCGGLKGVQLPDGLEYVGIVAFYGSGLQQVTLPGTLRELGGLALVCKSLKTVWVGEGCTADVEKSVGDWVTILPAGAHR